MSEEQATNNKKSESIGPIEAYNILLQRQVNEDRLLTERTLIFLTSSSFLFLAFVMLLNQGLINPIFKILRIWLPITGILLTYWLYHLSLSATNALSFWHSGQEKIEETESKLFAYMRENEITPHLHGKKAARGIKRWKNENGKWVFQSVKRPWSWINKPLQKRWLRPVHPYFIAGIFYALWTVSLILAAINYN
jgi:hypothetical protein